MLDLENTATECMQDSFHSSVDNIQRRDRSFAILLEKGSNASNFLEVAVEALATGLGYKWAAIGEFYQNKRGVQLKAYWCKGKIEEPFCYDLEGTPCDDVLAKAGFCYFPDNIDILFPKDLAFVEWGVKAYQGTVFFGVDGQPMGHIFAFHDQPDHSDTGQRDFLRLIADWVGLELRRRHADEQREQAERELSQRRKMEAVGQLSCGIAHEINTPVQYVGDNLRFLMNAFTEIDGALAKVNDAIIQRDTLSSASNPLQHMQATLQSSDLGFLRSEIPASIAQSLDGIDRINKIVQAMKEFSHPGAQDKIETDIHHAIETTVVVAYGQWNPVADMVFDFDPHLPPVPCLPGEFNQVLLNIIVNAAHAIESKADHGRGTITIGTRKYEDWVDIWVHDTGCGIHQDHAEKIFNPFFTTKPPGKGTGQGLAICHNIIVERHKGRITWESQEGKGTTFTIHLPLLNERCVAA